MDDDQTPVLLELYKTAVEMADRVSARRAGANSFFLTLNVALAALVGVVSSARKASPHGNLPSFDAFGLCVTAAAGMLMASTWWALLRYYRRLNAAKFEVINMIERRFPVQPYADEWSILHPEETVGGARNTAWRGRVKHREATVVEQVVPVVFVMIYLVLAVRTVLQ